MLFLIEGVDLTGKSSLASDLADDLGGNTKVLHFDRPRSDDPVAEYLTAPVAVGYHPGSGQHIVYDRGHIGELVWPNFFDRESIVEPWHFHAIESYLLVRGCVLVLAQRALGSLTRAFEEADPPEPLPIERVAEANHRFIHQCEQSTLPKCTYDHAFRDEERKKVLAMAEEAERYWVRRA